MLKTLRKIFVSAIAVCAAAATVFLAGCQEESGLIRYSRTYYDLFGASAEMQLYGDFSSESAQSEAVAFGSGLQIFISQLSDSLSSTNANSYISLFNAAQAGQTVELDSYAYEVFSIALEMYEETDGYFNPGVWYSVDLYDFSVRVGGQTAPYDRENNREELPEEKYVEAFRELSTAFGDIELYEQDGRYFAVKPEKTVTVDGDDTVYSLKVDLGGIGKGYTADLVDGRIDSAGYDCASFNFGSSTMTLNGSYTSLDGTWRLTYSKPREDDSGQDYYMQVRVRDTALSTSGDYMQYYEIGGTRYCHIINPYTGSPIETGIITATCLGGSAAEADARTTAICAMGLERAIDYLNSDAVKGKGLKIAFVYEGEDGSLYVITNMAEGEYELLDGDNYTVASFINSDGNVELIGGVIA